MSSGDLDVSKYLEVVGRMGRHQWLTLFMVGLLTLQFGWNVIIVVFTHSTADFRCTDDGAFNTSDVNTTFDNECKWTSVVGNISVTKQCQTFTYNNAEHGETAIEKFDLICKNNFMSTIIEMASMASFAVGMLVGSYLSDRYGRKPICVGCCFFAGLFGIMQSFSINVAMYATTKVMASIFFAAFFSPSFALMVESVSVNNRAHVLNSLELFWVAGVASTSLISYLFKSWWKTQLFCSVPAVGLSIIYIWALDESPRWLASSNQTTKALAVLKKMAQMNGIDVETTGLSFDANTCVKREQDVKVDRPKESFWRIWKHKRIVIRFFVFSYAWISCSLGYYVLSIGVRDLPGSVYLNNLYSSIVEGIGYLGCFSITWLGRKWPTVAAFLTGAAALFVFALLTAFSPDEENVIIAMNMIGKVCVTAAWQIIIVWESELYPTTHRCTLISLNTVAGRIGSVAAPFVVNLKKFVDVPNVELIMPVLIVVLMVIGGLLHIIPPETNKRRMPEFIKEANRAEFPMEDEAGSSENGESGERGDDTKLDLLSPEDKEQNL